MPQPKVNVAGSDGTIVGVTDEALDVHLKTGAGTIDIGDVSLLLDGTAADYGVGDVNTTGRTLRVTLASNDVHFGAVGAAADVDGVIHGQLEYIGNQTNAAQSYLALISRGSGNAYSVSQYGVPSWAVRNDTLADLAGDDNDYTPLQVNASGALYTTGGEVENAAVQSEPLLIGGRYDLSSRTLGDGDAGAIALTAKGHVITDERIYTFGYNVFAEGTSEGRAVAAVRNDTLATLANTDNEFAPFQVDAQGALYTTHGITGLASDDNPTVGTSAEQLITDGVDGATACKRVDIMAHPSNTGYIWVGDAAVSVDGLNGGIRLSPGDFYSMDIDNTGDIYVIATVDTENVCYNYFT